MSALSNHTPGPWRLRSELGSIVEDNDGRSIAAVHSLTDRSLIAAAPDLLAACRALITCNDQSEADGEFDWGGHSVALELTIAALAKVDGIAV